HTPHPPIYILSLHDALPISSTRNSVITYIEGRANGYSTYGDYGDVIIFRRAGTATPIIHRAIMYVNLHANLTADVPDILLLPTTDRKSTRLNSSHQIISYAV